MIQLRPPSELVDATPAVLEFLARNMREDEKHQFMALTGATEFDPIAACMGFANQQGVRFALADKHGKPYCAGGYSHVIPGVWQSWMVGTDEGWSNHWRTITKATKWLIQELFDGGARRLQTNFLASRTHIVDWHEKSLHMVHEGTYRGFGSGGEDLALYAITREDWYGEAEEVI